MNTCYCLECPEHEGRLLGLVNENEKLAARVRDAMLAAEHFAEMTVLTDEKVSAIQAEAGAKALREAGDWFDAQIGQGGTYRTARTVLYRMADKAERAGEVDKAR